MVHSVGCVFALSGACKIETGGPLRQDGQADWPRAARRDRAAGRCARTGRLTGHARLGGIELQAAAPRQGRPCSDRGKSIKYIRGTNME